jgi:1-acyl-sn-glycerol-3-phosphate acyltransferase
MFNFKILYEYRNNAKTHDVRRATAEMLDGLGVEQIEVQGKIPDQGPILIIANHISVLDSLVLMSQIERADFHFVALSTYDVYGPETAEKLLPIYRKRKLNHKMYEYPLCLHMHGKLPKQLSIQEIRKRNRQTIRLAAALVNEGKAVSIFPTGSVGKTDHKGGWKIGVGYLVKEISNQNTKVVFARIDGTKKSDLLAFLRPALSRIFFKSKSVSISFSESIPLSTLISKENEPAELVKQLKKAYSSVQW